ncbi:MAG: hypothetical protein MHM6MM_004990 [Cercozoa sp. M6MM]
MCPNGTHALQQCRWSHDLILLRTVDTACRDFGSNCTACVTEHECNMCDGQCQSRLTRCTGTVARDIAQCRSLQCVSRSASQGGTCDTCLTNPGECTWCAEQRTCVASHRGCPGERGFVLRQQCQATAFVEQNTRETCGRHNFECEQCLLQSLMTGRERCIYCVGVGCLSPSDRHVCSGGRIVERETDAVMDAFRRDQCPPALLNTSNSCLSRTDCRTCVSSSTPDGYDCTWCPLSRTCVPVPTRCALPVSNQWKCPPPCSGLSTCAQCNSNSYCIWCANGSALDSDFTLANATSDGMCVAQQDIGTCTTGIVRRCSGILDAQRLHNNTQVCGRQSTCDTCTLSPDCAFCYSNPRSGNDTSDNMGTCISQDAPCSSSRALELGQCRSRQACELATACEACVQDRCTWCASSSRCLGGGSTCDGATSITQQQCLDVTFRQESMEAHRLCASIPPGDCASCLAQAYTVGGVRHLCRYCDLRGCRPHFATCPTRQLVSPAAATSMELAMLPDARTSNGTSGTALNCPTVYDTCLFQGDTCQRCQQISGDRCQWCQDGGGTCVPRGHLCTLPVMPRLCAQSVVPRRLLEVPLVSTSVFSRCADAGFDCDACRLTALNSIDGAMSVNDTTPCAFCPSNGCVPLSDSSVTPQCLRIDTAALLQRRQMNLDAIKASVQADVLAQQGLTVAQFIDLEINRRGGLLNDAEILSLAPPSEVREARACFEWCDDVPVVTFSSPVDPNLNTALNQSVCTRRGATCQPVANCTATGVLLAMPDVRCDDFHDDIAQCLATSSRCFFCAARDLSVQAQDPATIRGRCLELPTAPVSATAECRPVFDVCQAQFGDCSSVGDCRSCIQGLRGDTCVWFESAKTCVHNDDINTM